MKVLKYVVICCLISVFAAFPIAFMVSSQTPPMITLQPFVSGLSSPLFVTNAKDGTKRLFILQQGGIIKVVQPGSNTPTDFLNITSRIVSGGERGLLGLTFHPEFTTNGYFFVNYTRAGDGATIIARYKTVNSDNLLGDPNSEKILLTIAQPFTNHNGGMIEFGPDGSLYIGMGDGGSANDPGNRAQNINELLGKFLRITPTLDAGTTTPAYTIPADNPFVGVDGADEIYAIGMRNPFRWSFDRGGTRQLWAADVGQGALEEVDIITRGGNYGWRIMEGSQCTPGVNPNCTPPDGHIPPIFEYSNAGSPRCSITGGYVYRGTQATLPDGSYIYGDYCTGEILLWNNNQQTLLLDTTRNISSFGEDEDGELYVVGLGGTVEKIVTTQTPTPTPTPVATPTPMPQTCTPFTTVTEGDLFPGGIVSFGVSSGAGSVTVDHVNAGTGLQSLTVVGAPTNAIVNIPAFAPGTQAPVVVTFTTPSPGLAVDFTLRAASTFHAANIRVRCLPQ
jgi:glucose/arabinose dehydrogenase